MEINSLEGFTILFGLAQGVGAILIILMAVWLINFRGGYAWTSDPSLEFNWHPLLMTVGLIYLYANSILIYRAFRSQRKNKLKLAHTFTHVFGFILTIIGLQAVFDSHNLADPPIPNMYSLHSWVGLSAVIMFACQWVAGLVTFLFPTLSAPLRAAYLPVHVFFGLYGFILAVAAALLGLTEKAMFTLKTDYSKMVGEGVLINIIGIFMILFAALVVYIVSTSSYKRQPIPEDEMLLASASQ